MRERTLAVPEGLHIEVIGQGIHGLCSHTVETYGFLECLIVEFASGVQLAGHIHHGVERNTASVVPYGHLPAFDIDGYGFPEAHRELVNRVVHNLFQKHVYSVTRVVSVPQSSNVHSGPAPDVFVPFEGLNVVFGIFNFVRHIVLAISRKGTKNI